MHVDPFRAGRLIKCPKCSNFVVVPLEKGSVAKKIRLDIRTERLSLPNAKPSDWKALIEMCSHEPNFKYELDRPCTARELRKTLRIGRYPRGVRKSNCFHFLIQENELNKVIGKISLQMDSSLLTASIGLMIHEPYQKQGYGRESVEGIVDFSFHSLNLAKVTAACDSENVVCIRMFDSLNFEREGFLRNWTFHAERGWIDSPLFARFHPCHQTKS